MIATRIRAMRQAHWLGLFGVVLALWTLLAALAGTGLYETLCSGAGEAGFAGVVLMWAVMGLAMMLPTALPAFAVWDDLPGTNGPGFAALALGFGAVWTGFALPAAALQVWVSSAGATTAPAFTAAVFAAAGLYQFSPLKAQCLSRCRMPLTAFMAHWDEGPFRIGLRLGVDCLGCCWALMALGLVGGAMSLGFMGLAMLLMAAEKLPDIGDAITRPLGVGLIALAALTLLI